MTFRCLIVDDEPLARDLLTQFIGQLPSLTLVASCPDALSGLTVLHTEPVDLLFTDIKMPQVSGIELIRSLSKPPKVILTTAFSDYALDGFEVGAVDYLVKPFSFARFLRAIDRALGRAQPAESTSQPVAAATFLFLKVDKKIVKVMLADVRYWQAYGNYVKVFLRDGRLLLATETMTHLETLLPADQFIRVHKSYIVTLSEVTEYQPTMVCLGTVSVPIGDRYRRQFLDAVG
ncbi:LytR/AlgR family response regulator transcription factor [Fibrella aquatilis]|uniref:Response regulator transcription factor n=1 Tax=Fibrella aquatilis TaxID=2817059 RepID=A0A939JU37_9BACT|nr:LytTR family DNA-binding domain-containing protein [Fibrella aquatilis]MBO0929392.1 response regulator transcription factor [Fibrella aquatilis]